MYRRHRLSSPRSLHIQKENWMNRLVAEKYVGRRQVGKSDLFVSPVSLGCWPMAGISSLGVNDQSSIATVHAALNSGINHFDTAYSYGHHGESDRILRLAFESYFDLPIAQIDLRSKGIVIASKVGSHYDANKERILDCSTNRITQELDEILLRLGISCIDLLYLHTPDGKTPMEEVARTMKQFVEDGKVRYVGLSNVDTRQADEFAKVIQPIVVQPPFNMVQQETVNELRSFCDRNQCGIASYWPLMKGLLGGKIGRDYQFDPLDRRLTYPIFQGEQFERSQVLLDHLKRIAKEVGWPVASLVVHWTFSQPNITTVLCGAKRPDQIRESANAMSGTLTHDCLREIDEAIAQVRIN